MELYEALKSGTSAEDLEAAFRKELNAAQERISAEQRELDMKEAEAAYLEDCRAELAEAIYDYAIAFLGETAVDEADVTVDDIEEKLLEAEKEIINLHNIQKKLEKTFNSLNKVKVSTDDKIFNDDNIIENFLKSL